MRKRATLARRGEGRSNLECGRKEEPLDAYCMKCKTTRTMRNPTQVTMKNGRPATQGTCPVCGTKMFKIGSGAAAKR